MVCRGIIEENLQLIVFHFNDHRVFSCEPEDQNYQFDKIIALRENTSQQRAVTMIHALSPDYKRL